MRRTSTLLLIVTCLLAAGCQSSRKAPVSKTTTQSPTPPPPPPPRKPRTKFKFENKNTLSSVLDHAATLDKPVFVDFYTSWCTPCKMMDEDVFTDVNLANYFNKYFVNYKVDCEKGNGANLASIFNISTYPTLLFLDEKGNVLVRFEGAAYYTRMTQLAKQARTAYANK